MGDMDEDRVFGDSRGETVAYVASGQGVATVRVSSDRVGRFSLARPCRARDVAAVDRRVGPSDGSAASTDGSDAPSDGSPDPPDESTPSPDGRVIVATAEDVLVGPDPFEPTGFGPAAAVGGGPADGGALAAGEDGTVSRYRDGEWEPVGAVEDVRAVEGDLVATADGVYRVDGDGLVAVGLADVRDVAVDGAPLAATDDGLYRLANGWRRDVEGEFATVAAAAGDAARAHAATAERLFAREDGEWTPVDLPVAEPVVGVAYGECVYAVTGTGTFLVEADPERTPDGTGGWRHRSLGLPAVVGIAVP